MPTRYGPGRTPTHHRRDYSRTTVCHVFQTDEGDSKIAICGERGPISGGLHLSDGLHYHHPGDYCERCGRLPCAECDKGALIIAERLKLPMPPWAKLSKSGAT